MTKKNGNVSNYTLFFNTIPTEFNAFATFFWQTINSTKIENFCLSLQTASLSKFSRKLSGGTDRKFLF